MRKGRIVMLAAIMVLVMTASAAAIDLGVNGREYSTANPNYISDGITAASTEVIARMLGAAVTINGDTITITENDNVLIMSINSVEASYNGQAVTVPMAPNRVDGEVLLPLRFVLETFGADVAWDNDLESICVLYDEQRGSLSATQMLVQCSEKIRTLNTYMMDVDLTAAMGMTLPGVSTPGDIDMTGKMLGMISADPMVLYIKQDMTLDMAGLPDEGLPENTPVCSETLINQDGVYMTMPDHDGWIEMDLGGVDVQQLVAQYENQNPAATMADLEKGGMVVSYGNDEERNGQKYWVIEIVADADCLQSQFNQVMNQIPIGSESADMASIMDDMTASLLYRVWINQETGLADFLALDGVLGMSVEVPAMDESPSGPVTMDITIDADYNLYGFGESLAFPDVSNAVPFSTLMEDSIPVQ